MRREAFIALISRGLSPARSVMQAGYFASHHRMSIRVIDGLSLVDAKNEAVEIATNNYQDLIIVEDDVVASGEQWQQLRCAKTIAVTAARHRDGKLMIEFDAAGRVLFTGSTFLKIPLEILRQFEPPVFRCWNVGISDDKKLFLQEKRDDGLLSNMYFWYCVQLLGEPVEYLGEVKHLQHPLNNGVHNHANPIEIKEIYEYK